MAVNSMGAEIFQFPSWAERAGLTNIFICGSRKMERRGRVTILPTDAAELAWLRERYPQKAKWVAGRLILPLDEGNRVLTALVDAGFTDEGDL